MKKVSIWLIMMPALSGYAQTIDSAARIAATYFEATKQACKDQNIWPVELYGRMMFVDPATRTTWANIPDSAGVLKPDGKVYKGVLPKSVVVANTEITWEGKKWAVILWPIPVTGEDRLNLLVHESFHRIQDDIGLPGRSPMAAHLNTMNGRIWFMLELQALKAALNKPMGQRQKDLTAALLFREKRKELFPGTFKNESILEMNEGLAEYTGVMLGRQKDSIPPHLNAIIDDVNRAHPTLIRSFAYVTGPVYGYLLYQKDPAWTHGIDSNSNFPALISKYYHLKLTTQGIDKEVENLAGQYNGPSIIRAEKLKEARHQQQLKYYTNLFTKKPVLIVALQKMNINFNPNNLFDLGDYGTVYPTAFIKDLWGDVEVTQGGMLMKDWKIIYLPLTSSPVVNNHVLTGTGWKLTLNNGWKIEKAGSLQYKVAKDANNLRLPR